MCDIISFALIFCPLTLTCSIPALFSSAASPLSNNHVSQHIPPRGPHVTGLQRFNSTSAQEEPALPSAAQDVVHLSQSCVKVSMDRGWNRTLENTVALSR